MSADRITWKWLLILFSASRAIPLCEVSSVIHSTKHYDLIIQILWTFTLLLLLKMIIKPGHNFAHATAAQLSGSLESISKQREFSQDLISKPMNPLCVYHPGFVVRRSKCDHSRPAIWLHAGMGRFSVESKVETQPQTIKLFNPLKYMIFI